MKDREKKWKIIGMIAVVILVILVIVVMNHKNIASNKTTHQVEGLNLKVEADNEPNMNIINQLKELEEKRKQ